MSRRLPVVAIAIAGVSFVVAAVAIVVMIQRGSPAPAAAAAPPPSGPTLVDVTAKAEAVVDLLDGALDDARSGWRASAATARALGLAPNDVIVGIAGRAIDRNLAVHSALSDASLGHVRRLYLEVQRDGTARVVRVQIDGDLRTAFAAKRAASLGGSRPGSPDALDPFASPRPADPNADLVAQIERVDDTHVNVPAQVVEQILQNPMAIAKGARIVPAMKDGAPVGFKLYAVRSSSIYAAIGLHNGDTVRGINGFPMTSPDRALEVYTQLRGATKLELDVLRRGQPVTLRITITK